MDILRTLLESPDDLYLEDLDFFETELATGGQYTAAYRSQCRSEIKRLRAQMRGGAFRRDGPAPPPPVHPEPELPQGIILERRYLLPEPPSQVPLASAQQVYSDISALRKRGDYKSAFKKYAAGSPIIGADFLEANFSFFSQWELNAIVSVKQLGEPFLEKYFGVLDHGKIARYQLFSEGFFMRHFTQLDPAIVLGHGKNMWKKRTRRSKQLDIFLRLEGVRL